MELGIPKIEDNAIKVVPKIQKNLANTHTEEEWAALEAGPAIIVNNKERPGKSPQFRGADDRSICIVGGNRHLFSCLRSIFIFLLLLFFVFGCGTQKVFSFFEY